MCIALVLTLSRVITWLVGKLRTRKCTFTHRRFAPLVRKWDKCDSICYGGGASIQLALMPKALCEYYVCTSIHVNFFREKASN